MDSSNSIQSRMLRYAPINMTKIGNLVGFSLIGVEVFIDSFFFFFLLPSILPTYEEPFVLYYQWRSSVGNVCTIFKRSVLTEKRM